MLEISESIIILELKKSGFLSDYFLVLISHYVLLLSCLKF